MTICSNNQTEIIGIVKDKAKFPLGMVVSTRGVSLKLPPDKISEILNKHITGDWGQLNKEDRQLNEFALENGERIFSSYPLSTTIKKECGEDKVWVITEYDRSLTTILFPSEY